MVSADWVPIPSHGSLAMVSSLNLTYNAITHEEALLPLLRLPALRMLLLYGNPFLSHGGASPDLIEVSISVINIYGPAIIYI